MGDRLLRIAGFTGSGFKVQGSGSGFRVRVQGSVRSGCSESDRAGSATDGRSSDSQVLDGIPRHEPSNWPTHFVLALAPARSVGHGRCSKVRGSAARGNSRASCRRTVFRLRTERGDASGDRASARTDPPGCGFSTGQYRRRALVDFARGSSRTSCGLPAPHYSRRVITSSAASQGLFQRRRRGEPASASRIEPRERQPNCCATSTPAKASHRLDGMEPTNLNPNPEP